jgi:ribosome-associated toxin RatA of RatAB toxin-antitoxin module
MAEHHATVVINAPVHQVYTLFTHFNDFPKFMSFVKEVTYYDEQRSHWVVQVAGTQEWDAVNEDWIPDRQVGWRSTDGLENNGRVRFQPLRADQTLVDVYINYTPPGGALGATASKLGLDRFDTVLQQDLNNFARMVEQAPPGALDPMQSHYLFHSDSALAKGIATGRQQAAMRNDPMMSESALRDREASQQRAAEEAQQVAQQRQEQQQRVVEQERQATREQASALARQAELDRQERAERVREAAREQRAAQEYVPDPAFDTLGGRGAGLEHGAIGDRDAQGERFPMYHTDPMSSRAPMKDQDEGKTPVSDIEVESPWRATIRGRPLEGAQPAQEQASEQERRASDEQPPSQENPPPESD